MGILTISSINLGKEPFFTMVKKHLSHAYMIVGPESEQRRKTVSSLSAALLCPEENAPCGLCRDCRKAYAGIHPDMIFIERLPKEKGVLHQNILVDQIRDVAKDAVVSPNEALRKIYILPEADRMNRDAQNALLKVLEEPPTHAAFLLCTAAGDALLPTVRSRCLRVDDFAREETLPPLSDLAAAYLEAAASGDLADVTMFCMLRTKLSREDTDAFLVEVSAALCDILCARRKNPGLTQHHILTLTALMDKAQDYSRRNISPKQVFGMLAAETLR